MKMLPIPDWPGYCVSSCGCIFSTAWHWRKRGIHEMALKTDRYGYYTVRLHKNRKRKTVTVHRLIAQAWLPTPPLEFDQIRHLDGDQTNNSVANLCWGTVADNIADRERHGTTSRGSKHSEAIKRGLRRNGRLS